MTPRSIVSRIIKQTLASQKKLDGAIVELTFRDSEWTDLIQDAIDDAVAAYARAVDDPKRMHLHYAGCPFKPWADKLDMDIPEPRPECTCAETHMAAYWKGQWVLERGYHNLTRKAMLAYRARAYQYAYPAVVELDKEHAAVLEAAAENSGTSEGKP